MSTPTKTVSVLVGVDTKEISFRSVFTMVSTLGINTYLKENAKWRTLETDHHMIGTRGRHAVADYAVSCGNAVAVFRIYAHIFSLCAY